MKPSFHFESDARGEIRRGLAARSGGSATLPIIIAVAVAVALVQVPLLYKNKSSNKFSGTQKANISAKSMAEAGIDAIITDIGRKSILVTAVMDTTPYSNIPLGRGDFTTRVSTYHINPDRVEVVSTGHNGNSTQSIRAKMELVKSLTTIPFDTPPISLWGIRGTPPTLYYQSLAERDSGWAWIHPEGEVQLDIGGVVSIDDFTVAPNGTMYFVNNITGSNSVLFKIRPIDLDNNPATPVIARSLGSTGIVANSDSTIRGLTFIARDTTGRNGVLYAVGWKNKKVYELSLETGAATFVSNIIPEGISSATAFWCDAVSQDLSGALYVVRNNAKSELWRFKEFVQGPVGVQDTAAFVAQISGMKDKTRALAGHPNGYMYALDDERWYRINPFSMPVSNRTTALFLDSAGFKGMGFHFEREHLKLTGNPIKHKINICHRPPGNCLNSNTIQIDSSALNAHLNHGSGCLADVPGYCGIGSPALALQDTTIQLKIISWEEIAGEIAHTP